jgi:hypothetical protein
MRVFGPSWRGGVKEAVWNFFKKNNKQDNDRELLLRTLHFLLLFFKYF